MKITTPAPPDNINLLLVDPVGMDRPLSEVETSAVFAEPPYWSFCWGSGKVLAEYIFASPELVLGKTILDFGCGSGIVGIAAALSGASRVICCDLDPFAQMAATYNAQINNVVIEIAGDVFLVKEKIDVLFAADVLYDRENLPLLTYFRQLSDVVVIADSRVKNFDEPGFTLAGEAYGVTEPDLGELESVKQVRFYQAGRLAF